MNTFKPLVELGRAIKITYWHGPCFFKHSEWRLCPVYSDRFFYLTQRHVPISFQPAV